MSKRLEVGIIGYGSFGKFLAYWLASYCDVTVYNRTASRLANLPSNCSSGSLKTVGSKPIVILAINISAYEYILPKLRKVVTPDTLIVDVASVKIEPLQLIRKYCPGCKVLATHPLFGPESAGTSLAGQTIVFCNKVSQQAELESALGKLGLKIVHMSPREHDRQMATVQALTFFIAQGLLNMELAKPKLSTPTFQKLLSLAEIEKHHSQELFETIQKHNPYARSVRKKLISELTSLDKKT